MEQFLSREGVAALEQGLSAPGGENGCAALVTLAWHLRQRDCPRALALATQADALLAGMDEGASERRRLSARLALVRGEISLLFDDLEAAQRCAQAAATAFAEIDDAIGEGDTHWLQASIGLNQGQGDHVEACLNLAMGEYRRGADPLRVQAAQARQLVYAAFRDTAGAAASLERLFPLGQSQPASVLAWLAAARANVGGLTGNPGMAIKHGLEAYQAARDSGQLRQALVSVTNAAESIATMGDLDAALEWSERAVALARRTGWPAIVGFCLMQLGDALRQIARHDEARALLQEALALVERQSGSRNYAQVLGSLGQLALEQGDHADALVWFARLGAHAHVHLEPDLLIKAGRGQASALVHLGRAQEARHMAEVALNLAREQGDAQGQIQMHAVLANMHAKHSLSEPAEMTAPTPALHHLKQALRIAADIDGYTVAPELFTQLAAAHAVVGNYRSAYDCTLSSEAARSKRHTEEAKKRALAMQIRNEVEHARAETELHRQLAATLQESTATLEILGAVGREITASLDAQAVFAALHRHVQELLDATVFAVYLIGDDGATLHTAFGVEAGVNLPARSVPIDSPTSQFARCVRERQEIAIESAPGAQDLRIIPGTLATLSLLYVPLIVGERLLGAMSIQSPKARVYGERERSIFRALCAYGAIALDNAAAYGAAAAAQRRADQTLAELRQTQAQLVEQNRQLERLAVTDQLTGLFNRLRLDQTLEEERLRNLRYATSFCILLLDVDQFKSVNDRFGHPVGDQVLMGIARDLQDGIREVDVVGRWGGEEFMVICRETTIEGALVLAEKLRSLIASHVYPQVGARSASFGVAMFHPGEALTETIARADAGLYRAKQGGRNRVQCVEAPTPTDAQCIALGARATQ